MGNENNALQIFSFEKQQVRFVLDENGEPWFIAKDVVEGIGNVWKGLDSIKHIPEEWADSNSIGVRSKTGVEQERDMLFLSEQGVNFYLIRSDNPRALPLQKKIAGEILPSIRKYGFYGLPNFEGIVPGFKQPKNMTEAFTMLAEFSGKIDHLEETIKTMTPKVEAFNEWMTSEVSYNGMEAAKLLGFESMGRNTLYAKLREFKIWNVDNIPYQRYINNGWFRFIVEGTYTSVRFTAIGMEGIRKLFLKKGIRYSLPKLNDILSEPIMIPTIALQQKKII